MDDFVDDYMDLMSLIQHKVECPVCVCTMVPPVSQCTNGHAVCALCRPRLTTCPVCRGHFILFKNRFLDDILITLPHKCKHGGCEEYVMPEHTDDHEKWCGFQKTRCEISGCAWEGPSRSILHHLDSNHEDNPVLPVLTKQESAGKITLKPVGRNVVVTPCYVYDQFFWWIIRYDDEENTYKVQFKLVPRSLSSKFTFSLRMMMEFGDSRRFCAVSTTVTPDTALSENEHDNCFTLQASALKYFFGEKNQLPCKIYISKINHTEENIVN